MKGVTLSEPYAKALHNTQIRELRPKTANSALRVFYRFDPKRNAVVICGGDKKGQHEKDFYKTQIRRAEALYQRYLEENADDDA